MHRAFDELGNINIYEIYADMCTEPRGLRRQVGPRACNVQSQYAHCASAASAGSGLVNFCESIRHHGRGCTVNACM